MTYYFGNRVHVLTSTVGTGTLELGQPMATMQGFDDIIDGSMVSYTIVEAAHWEVGTGTFARGAGNFPDTLSRDLVEASTNNDQLISLTGTGSVFVTPIASWLNSLATQDYVKQHIVYMSDTPPSSPFLGQIWFDTSDLQSYLWYEDP